MTQKNSKRAQVTVFIIIGIAILAVVGILAYLRVTTVEREVEVGLRQVTEIVPIEAQPVRTYIESAIEQTAEEGLRILGEHAGYIYTDSFNSNIVDPTAAEALEYHPLYGYKIPYWFYMESSNECASGCTFSTKMPPLCKQGRNCITSGASSIEEELERYINSELEKNLNSFESLTQQGFQITKQGAPNANVIIREGDIIIYIDYPLEVEKEARSKVTQFQKIIRSDLTEMYETAYEILNYEVSNCFVEDHLTNYIVPFMGLEADELPPYYDSSIGSSTTRIWPLFQVKNDLKKKTFDAIIQMGIYNTSNFVSPADNPNDRYNLRLDDYYIFYAVRKFHDLSVSLEYNPWWNPYLDIRPNDGSILMPDNLQAGFGLTSLFEHLTKTKTYGFDYMYSFPVVVNIEKEDSEGENHLFRFALESNIRGNTCFKSLGSITNMIRIKSELCTQEERRNDLTVSVTDETGQPLDGVEVQFYAGETCSIGSTDENGELKTKYPTAYGSFIRLKKEGYLDRIVHQSRFTNRITETLKRIREKNIVFRLIEEETLSQVSSQGAASAGEALEIIRRNLQTPKNQADESESILLTLIRNPDNYQDASFEQTVYFSEGQATPETINIVPGRYNVSIQLYLRKEGMSIPRELDRLCEKKSLLGSCKKVPNNAACNDFNFETTKNPACYLYGYRCEESTLADCVDEEIVYREITPDELPTIPNGGAVINSWQISSSELDKGNNIIFYLFRQDLPKRHRDFRFLQRYEDYSQPGRFGYAIRPKIE